jgi:benzoate-CoA ligase family protein
MREGRTVLRYQDIPEQFNVATWFVDRNVASGHGDRTALIAGDRVTTYAELAALTNRVGNVLRELGVRPGHRVLLALSDGVEFVATWYAAQKIGAVTAEVYTYLQPKDYRYYLDYTEAGVVVVDGVTLDRMREAAAGCDTLRHLLVVGVDNGELNPGEHGFSALVERAPEQLEAAPTDRDSVAIWKFTTGSTGKPKAAVHPAHSAVLSCEWYGREVLELRPDDVVLPVPKLFFGYARDLTALFPFGVGAAGIVFPERTTPERIFELVERHKPTILVQVPTMMAAMLAHPDAAERDLSCLRLCTSAGEALPRELYERWCARFGVDVLDGIGSSEAYHIYISNRPGRVRPGSTGELVPGYRAELAETGELTIEGDTAALLYWGEHEKTKQTFDGDRIRTGDLFERDEDGFFWYRGRADDLIKVGGIWVAPGEVEDTLLAHPDVVECAVVGDDRDGLTVARAYVVLQSTVEGAALQDFVRSRLSPHKVPGIVTVVDELPKTPSGKIDRRVLRG